MRGSALAPQDTGYDAARAVWNAMIDRKPALIVRCAGVADVIQAIAFARRNELPLSVRGGAHNIAGNAMCDDGLVIDLSGMRSVRVDPAGRRAYVEPGATLGDVDHETQAFGLATPLGINSTTGVAGLTLGGGFGWLTRKYGMTVDNLVSAELVTAEGQLVRTSAEDHPELFWGLRGGGGNFGVVTLFEYQLHPVGPELPCGLVVYPMEQARTLLRRYREIVDAAPEELNPWVVLRLAPPLPFLPPEVHGKPVLVFAFLYAGQDEQAGMKAIEPLRRLGTPYGEFVAKLPYVAWQKMFDPLLAPGARNYWKSHNFAELADAAIEQVVDYAAKLPSPHCEIFLGVLAGRASRLPKDSTAYAHRDTRFVMNVHGRWETAAEDAAGIAWAREFFKATAPYATGSVYVNFLTHDETERIPAAYGPGYERLARLKHRYDPANVFRLNQNIRPAA